MMLLDLTPPGHRWIHVLDAEGWAMEVYGGHLDGTVHMFVADDLLVLEDPEDILTLLVMACEAWCIGAD